MISGVATTRPTPSVLTSARSNSSPSISAIRLRAHVNRNRAKLTRSTTTELKGGTARQAVRLPPMKVTVEGIESLMLTDTLCESLTDFVTVWPSPQTPDGEPVISAITVIPVVLAGMVPLLYGAKHAASPPPTVEPSASCQLQLVHSQMASPML